MRYRNNFMLFQGFFLKNLRHGFSLFVFASLFLGRAAYANPLSLPQSMPLPPGSVYVDCVKKVGREGCAALAMAWSLCKTRFDESRGIERKYDRVSNEYLDALAAMNIKEGDLLNANSAYSGIVTELSASIMYEVCPSVLKSESGDRPIFVANLETMTFGVYREAILRSLLVRSSADADCKNKVPYDKCMRARQEFYFDAFR
jgi:hypothetical protein